jgi:hypothetical protein
MHALLNFNTICNYLINKTLKRKRAQLFYQFIRGQKQCLFILSINNLILILSIIKNILYLSIILSTFINIIFIIM